MQNWVSCRSRRGPQNHEIVWDFAFHSMSKNQNAVWVILILIRKLNPWFEFMLKQSGWKNPAVVAWSFMAPLSTNPWHLLPPMESGTYVEALPIKPTVIPQLLDLPASPENFRLQIGQAVYIFWLHSPAYDSLYRQYSYRLSLSYHSDWLGNPFGHLTVKRRASFFLFIELLEVLILASHPSLPKSFYSAFPV